MAVVDGEVIGRVSLAVVGLIVAFFLFYLALRDPTVHPLRRMRGWMRGLVRITAGSAAMLDPTAAIRRLLRP
ncbi:MAG TPA: hypothetical protein VF197_01595 [Methylomirabilota bacterium]|jgi:ammonia channel protein AmtB